MEHQTLKQASGLLASAEGVRKFFGGRIGRVECIAGPDAQPVEHAGQGLVPHRMDVDRNPRKKAGVLEGFPPAE